MGSQLALKSRIRSTESLAKIFNAQEMIASSHIAKARDVALNAKPYTDAIFDAVQALVAHTHITHPIAVKDEKNPRVAVLALTSDRGMAGPSDILKTIRETEEFTADTEAALDKAVDEFRSTFVSSAGKPLVEKKPDVDKAAPVDQEKIVAGEK